jgi:hypothetical protein
LSQRGQPDMLVRAASRAGAGAGRDWGRRQPDEQGLVVGWSGSLLPSGPGWYRGRVSVMARLAGGPKEINSDFLYLFFHKR